MAIPDFQSLMLPLLQAVADGKEYAMRAVVKALSDRYSPTYDAGITIHVKRCHYVYV